VLQRVAAALEAGISPCVPISVCGASALHVHGLHLHGQHVHGQHVHGLVHYCSVLHLTAQAQCSWPEVKSVFVPEGCCTASCLQWSLWHMRFRFRTFRQACMPVRCCCIFLLSITCRSPGGCIFGSNTVETASRPCCSYQVTAQSLGAVALLAACDHLLLRGIA
jgi:hypothetical protein